MARARGWWPIAGIVLGLVAANVAWNELATRWGYVPLGVAASAALLWLARRDGRSWDELGLAREHVGRGLRWGGVLVGIVLAAYLLAFATPATRELFLDDRVRRMGALDVVYYALVRVPLGTVLLEEVAFRGVLPAVLAARVRPALAWGASAVLFGCWHILPALGLGDVNPVAEDTVGTLPGWFTVVGAVASTTAVGVWFLFLRHRSRSLVAPIALHWATNGLGYLFAYAAWSVA